jgi:hypothetical protein
MAAMTLSGSRSAGSQVGASDVDRAIDSSMMMLGRIAGRAMWS